MPIIATDGSSLGTPMPDGTRRADGHGGWAAIIQFEEDHPIAPGFSQEIVGGKRSTTTGEIEVLGFLNALITIREYRQALDVDPDNAIITAADRFTIVSDSQYVVKTYREHLTFWISSGWKKSTPGKIKHLQLWQQIASLRDEVGDLVHVVHQKGHTKKSGVDTTDPFVIGNDRADHAAGIVSRSIRDTGYLPRPAPIVWRHNAAAAAQRESDMEKLRLLTERVLKTHGRAATVEAFRTATFNTGVTA